jgi:hypothetical protein
MDLSSPQATAAIVAACVALVTAVLTTGLTLLVAERKLRREHSLDFAAERVARQLMLHPQWEWRTFSTIRHFLGGFDDDELRRVLVRAGAVRGSGTGDQELWGLLDRHRNIGSPVKISAGQHCPS